MSLNSRLRPHVSQLADELGMMTSAAELLSGCVGCAMICRDYSVIGTSLSVPC